MTTTTVANLHGQARVDLAVEEAFTFFTESIGRWWPAEYHIGSSPMVDTILEPRPGGRWYERGADGTECDWGRVLTWEPPHRIVLTWQINGSWQYDPDPARRDEGDLELGGTELPGAERAARELVDVAPLRESGPLGESGITRRN